MTRLRLAIIGLGRVGMACATAIATTDDLAIAGIVRRPESLGQPRPDQLRDVPVALHADQLGRLDAALICLPAALVGEAALKLVQHGVPIVEAAPLPADALASHRQAIHRLAQRRRVAAVIGAGWDPGVLGIFSGLLAVLCPKGRSEMRNRPGISLHHTLAARSVPGVEDALCAELGTAGGGRRRYVYVELAPGAAYELAAQAIRSDPLFAEEETIVLPVESLASLEDEGHGVVLERWGSASGLGHQRFLLEGRFDRHAIAAQVMVAAARAAPTLLPGAYALADVPPAALWRGLHLAAAS
jgi:diaminopimelate dehydrogenase